MTRILALAVLAISVTPASAAVITWGAATGIAGDSDVSTNGTFVGALNLGGSNVTTTTVNGVTFTGLNIDLQTNVTSGIFNLSSGGPMRGLTSTPGVNPIASLSAAYQTLLGTSVFRELPTLTISGLTVGQSYEFQWWANRSGFPTNVQTTATAGNAVMLGSNTLGVIGGVGQFVIGTFTADATTQQIVFSGSDDSPVNGFQLRQLGAADEVPGPATIGVFGLMAVGALGWRRRVNPPT